MSRLSDLALVEEVVREAMAAISGGFVWAYTTQGHAYWEEVYHNLLDLVMPPKKKAPAKKKATKRKGVKK